MANDFDFYRIANAIAYLGHNASSQPQLDEVASKVNMSPFHFQRMFLEWAGVSPKKFLQSISLNRAKSILTQNQASLSDAAHGAGLSGPGRLHDLFVTVEGMTPGEYKNGGANLVIEYCFADTCFGRLLAANTPKGVCGVAFVDGSDEAALTELKQKFPQACWEHRRTHWHEQLDAFWQRVSDMPIHLHLHLKGTPFQLKVWEALLQIPEGKLTTYGQLAASIDAPKASRAVGAAVGDNPVAWLIPCHRVILSTGHFGQYHWGTWRKTAMIGLEGIK